MKSIFIERVIEAAEDVGAFGCGDAATLADQIMDDLDGALRDDAARDVIRAEITGLIANRLRRHHHVWAV